MPEGPSTHPPHIRIDQTPDELAQEIVLACSDRPSSAVGEFEEMLQSVTFSGRDTISESAITMSGAGRLVAVSLPYVSEGESTESLAESLGRLATALLKVQRVAAAKSIQVLAPDWVDSKAGTND